MDNGSLGTGIWFSAVQMPAGGENADKGVCVGLVGSQLQIIQMADRKYYPGYLKMLPV